MYVTCVKYAGSLEMNKTHIHKEEKKIEVKRKRDIPIGFCSHSKNSMTQLTIFLSVNGMLQEFALHLKTFKRLFHIDRNRQFTLCLQRVRTFKQSLEKTLFGLRIFHSIHGFPS